MSRSSTGHRPTRSDNTTKISEIARLPEVEKELKALRKRFRTLDEDIRNFESSVLRMFHEQGIDAGVMERIPGLGFEEPKIYKVVKFACRSLPGKGNRSGIRIIYAFHDQDCQVEYVEIYYKGDKENEDRGRIRKHYGATKVREEAEAYEERA